ncbi:MAG TPA: flagellar filament capping protein FliD [Polyangiaceae bacterium]|nr:flagellar filament capping protein FliD [Polyangiaceae bacterium]
MTNGINVAALGFGGFDTSSLVTSLVGIAQVPYNQLAAQQQNINSAQATISTFSSTLSALKSAAVALSDPTGFVSTTATSSDSSSVVATANGLAAPGQWSVSVSGLAQDQRSLSNGVASTTTALGLYGTLNIAGAQHSVELSPTDTLSDVAGKISDELAASGLRMQASIVNDGSGYHILVSGLDTGTASAFSLDESGLQSTGSYSLGFKNIQDAQDASLTVGGIPVTSPTNQVTGAIPGVTLALTQKTSNVTVSIAGDPSAVQQKIQTFITAYNAVVNGGHTISGFGTQKASNLLLQGDHAVRSSLDQLGAVMAQTVPNTSGAYTTLASVGIALNDDGTLALDSTKLAAALTADPTSVERLFVTDASNNSKGVMGTIGSIVDQLTSNAGNPVQAELDSFSSRSAQLTKEMAAMQQRITDYQTQLQKQFTQMNSTLAQYKQIASSLNSSSNSGSGSSSNGVL